MVKGKANAYIPRMTEANINDLPENRFVANDKLRDQAAAAVTVYGGFLAAGKSFNVKCLGYFDVPNNNDGQHQKALRKGYRYCFRFAAVAEDGRVYAVWEIYSASSSNLLKAISRTLEVDADWRAKGIGKAFAAAIRSVYPVAWSGMYTAAGAKLKDRVEQLESAAKPQA